MIPRLHFDVAPGNGDEGAVVRTAIESLALRYRQVVQREKQAEQVRAYRKFLNQTDAAMGKMKPDKEVGLRAAYVNRETGAAISLALFLGEDKQTPGTYRLVDMMPGVDRIEYQGASPAAAIDDFARGNAYPQGSVELQIPANQQGIPPLTRIIQTKGESDWSAWAGKLGWGSLGLMLAGGIAALIPGGQVVAGCLFVAAAGGGLASSGLSLYDRLQKAERADHVRAAADLHRRPDLAVSQQDVGDRDQEHDEQEHALRDHDDERPQPQKAAPVFVCEVFSHQRSPHSAAVSIRPEARREHSAITAEARAIGLVI